ncbi:phospholipase D family protein [Rahnella aquatilis]|jgi:phosphatidylserine/phosphatidylglycerophosphate/cardiolipin synthase-like enzyme|nr:phospholipase D family protein [Rahnella aquatilis]
MKHNRLRVALLVMLLSTGVCTASAAPSVQVGFSPEGSAQQLVLQTVSDARQSIRLMGYSFTSPDIAGALVAAKKRGVDVQVVLDEGSNRGKASVAAMNLLVNAGIPVRTVSQFKIMHDKVIIIDNQTIETGSYNYTLSAARSNSENALVLHDVPDLAQTYLAHWQSRWALGKDWVSLY